MQRKPPRNAKARGNRHNTQRTCDGKVRYRDKDEAQKALQRLVRDSSRDRRPQRAYYHHDCRGWHLSSKADHWWLDDAG